MMKFLYKTLIKGIVISFVIATVIIFIQIVYGRQLVFDTAFLEELGLYCLFGSTLTMINVLYFDYLNNRVVWDRYKKYRLVIGVAGSISLTMAGIFLLRTMVHVGFKGIPFQTFLQEEKAKEYIVSLFITLVISLFFHSLYFYKKSQENKVKEQKIIAGTASAQFESLKNQIDPHFLFNSLNVLASLIEENPDNASKFTTSLSKIYRYVLEQKDKELVTVAEELAFAKTYMNLLKMRFEESLYYEVPEIILNPEGKVAPLSLQLLLENTVKHNVVSEEHPLHIRIFEQNNYLVIENDYQKKEVLQDGGGVGLQNIINRYAILTDRKVIIESNAKIFSVKIPILTKQVMKTEIPQHNINESYIKAQKQVKAIKAFYSSLISYCFVIPFLAFINYQTAWGFKWFFFPMFGWGFGLTIHAFNVFGYGARWEERKIKELMKKDDDQQIWK
ncbi:2TM domain-containing protein [Flavobacterium sp. '19STA2R22 D10 B1']|uniref:2TM domain-containing protein n=1 Tax=Flavobacterium aerium TaxID=3037261 RepID=UPI00278BD9B9|nr:histidine kinase [Flavobacterium sp. '19STA2R22 D10 B1']